MKFIAKILSMTLVLLTFPGLSAALEYTCTIKRTSKLSANGLFINHGWAANYMNRQFTVDRESGRVINTTALKQRLSNSNADNEPLIINKDKANEPFRVMTHFKDTGKFALLEIQDHTLYSQSEVKPFYYHTDIGMILTGTCIKMISQ